MKFDTFLATVGDWGRFQKIKYTLICLTYMLPPIMVYTYTFTAAIPDFHCRTPDVLATDSYTDAPDSSFASRYEPTEAQCKAEQKKLSLTECRRCYTTTNSASNRQADSSTEGPMLQKCEQFVFDKLYYERTLVEEVRATRV